jgi:hypothetical protein
MARRTKSQKKTRVTIVIGIVLLLFLGTIYIYSDNLFSFIDGTLTYGEELYIPMDKLIFAGTYDKGTWGFSPSNECCWSGRYGQGCINPYDTVVVNKNENSIGLTMFGGSSCLPILETPDLRLRDTKITFRSVANRCGTNKGKTGSSCIYASTGQTLWCLPSPLYGDSPSGEASIEVRWLDYGTGDYQIFVNDKPVTNGNIPEGQELKLYTQSDPRYGWDECGASSYFVNPRYTDLFGCDPKDNETIQVVCIAGETNIQLADLEGFKRFCPELSAIRHKDGVSDESRNIYWELATLRPYHIDKNEMWEFTYVKDSNVTGVAYDCEEFYEIENLVDLETPIPVIADNSLIWTSVHNMKDLLWNNLVNKVKSGDSTIFLAVANEDDYPFDDNIKRYPNDLSASQLPVEGNRHTFIEGESYTFNEYFSAELEKITWRGYLYDGLENFQMRNTWKLNFAKEGVDIKLEKEDVYDINKKAVIDVSVKNKYPFEGKFIVTLTLVQTAVNQHRVLSEEIYIGKGDTEKLSFDLPTNLVGEVEIYPVVVLDTDLGIIPVSSYDKQTYNVMIEDTKVVVSENITVETTDDIILDEEPVIIQKEDINETFENVTEKEVIRTNDNLKIVIIIIVLIMVGFASYIYSKKRNKRRR